MRETYFTGPMSIRISRPPNASWDEHFRFARAAAAHKVQRLGNQAGLRTLADIRRCGPNMATRDPNEFFTVAQKPGAHAIRAIISPPAQGEYPCCDAQSMSQMGQNR